MRVRWWCWRWDDKGKMMKVIWGGGGMKRHGWDDDEGEMMKVRWWWGWDDDDEGEMMMRVRWLWWRGWDDDDGEGEITRVRWWGKDGDDESETVKVRWWGWDGDDEDERIMMRIWNWSLWNVVRSLWSTQNIHVKAHFYFWPNLHDHSHTFVGFVLILSFHSFVC